MSALIAIIPIVLLFILMLEMISPQSIAIATAACDMQGCDGEILKAAIPYAIAYISIGGLMVLLAV